MKTLRFLFFALFVFTLQSSFAQQLISNFNSGVGTPHVLLSETSLNDYARITFRNIASPGNDFWDVAGQAAGAAGAKFNIYYHNGTTGADILSVDGPSQRVIVGGLTSASLAKFAVNGSGSVSDWFRIGGNTDGTAWNLGVNGNIITRGGTVALGANPTDKVGIFALNPLTRLSISPSTTEPKITLWDGGNANQHYGFGVSGAQLNYHVDIPASSHVFYAGGKNGNGTELMRIRGNGNVGIGTNNPAFKLDVIGDAKFSNIREVYQVQSSSDLEFTIDKNNSSPLFGFFEIFNGVGNHLFWVNEAGNAYLRGNVGIGVSGASHQLQLSQNSAAKPGSAFWTVISDERLKKDVKPYAEGLETILKIKPVTFRYNGKAGVTDESEFVGIIAQDMQKIAPHTVHNFTYEPKEGDKEEYLSFDGNALTYMLINAIKEQNGVIEKGNKENQELKNKMATMEERMAKLEALLGKMTNSGNATTPTNTTQDVLLNGGDQARLLQNAPNPFSEQTVVKYYLPKNTTDAQLRITDQLGRTLKTIKLEGTGEGQVNITAQELPVGTYTYTLLVGGKLSDVKQMILTER